MIFTIQHAMCPLCRESIVFERKRLEYVNFFPPLCLLSCSRMSDILDLVKRPFILLTEKNALLFGL